MGTGVGCISEIVRMGKEYGWMLASQGAEPSGHLLLLLPCKGLSYVSVCVPGRSVMPDSVRPRGL